MLKINPTHYDTLGVPQFASVAECEKAWKTKSFANNPDLFPQENEKARQETIVKHLNAAWYVLGDINRKLAYDNQLRQQAQPQADTPVREKKKWTIKNIVMAAITAILLLRVTLWLIKTVVEYF